MFLGSHKRAHVKRTMGNVMHGCLLFVGQLKMNKGCLASEKILYPNRNPDWVEDTQQMRSDIPVLDPSVFALDQRSHSIVSKAQ